MELKYKVGDNVKIVNYGHIVWYMEGENILRGDLRRDIIGKEGTVSETSNIQNTPKYAIDGIIGKHAWFNEDQLELI